MTADARPRAQAQPGHDTANNRSQKPDTEADLPKAADEEGGTVEASGARRVTSGDYVPQQDRRSEPSGSANRGSSSGEGTGSEKSATAVPAPVPQWRKILTTPGILAMAALTTIVSFAATEVATRVRSHYDNEHPLAISVGTDPSRIAGFAGRPDLWSSALIPDGVTTAGNPGLGCSGLYRWAHRNGVIDTRNSWIQIVTQGRSSEAVLISAIRARIVRREPIPIGAKVECPTAGNVKVRDVVVDLDTMPPRVTGLLKIFGFKFTSGELGYVAAR